MSCKNILWTLRTSITSVQVQSEEPWIPWELCKLVELVGRRRSRGRPVSLRGLPAHAVDSRALSVPATADEQPRRSWSPTTPGWRSRPRSAIICSRWRQPAGKSRESRRPFSMCRRPWRRALTTPGISAATARSGTRRMPDRSAHDPARRRPAHARRPERSGGQPGQAPPPGLPERLPDRPVGHVAHGHGRLGHPLPEGRRRRAFSVHTGRSTTSRP